MKPYFILEECAQKEQMSLLIMDGESCFNILEFLSFVTVPTDWCTKYS